jgi:hypothetical protein
VPFASVVWAAGVGIADVMHAAPRRPVASWPASLLPAALLFALLGTGAAASTGGPDVGAADNRPTTELQLVDERE